MARSSAPSRERIVAGAADMISRRGLNATSIRELAKHAKAPLGSTYHYFPEGKQQLATEAVRYAGGAVARILRKELDAGPVAGLRAFLALWRGIVVESDFRAGCPVLAVSVEEPPADEIPPALVAAAEAFEEWEQLLAAGTAGARRRLRPGSGARGPHRGIRRGRHRHVPRQAQHGPPGPGGAAARSTHRRRARPSGMTAQGSPGPRLRPRACRTRARKGLPGADHRVRAGVVAEERRRRPLERGSAVPEDSAVPTVLMTLGSLGTVPALAGTGGYAVRRRAGQSLPSGAPWSAT